jgi:UDP-N-acetylmuramate--alanine ligase
LGFSENTDTILTSFPGTNRRFEKLADNLYSDYGHHPVEIAATLQMARELSDHVVLVYQPHQNIRQYMIRDLYTDQFELAEKVYWLPTYLSREDPNLRVLNPEELIKNISNKDDIVIADLNDELWDNIEKARSDGKLVICMGAGTIDSWVRGKLA